MKKDDASARAAGEPQSERWSRHRCEHGRHVVRQEENAASRKGERERSYRMPIPRQLKQLSRLPGRGQQAVSAPPPTSSHSPYQVSNRPEMPRESIPAFSITKKGARWIDGDRVDTRDRLACATRAVQPSAAPAGAHGAVGRGVEGDPSRQGVQSVHRTVRTSRITFEHQHDNRSDIECHAERYAVSGNSAASGLRGEGMQS